jgi:predicted DNA-binding transcriptional regulator AlpA
LRTPAAAVYVGLSPSTLEKKRQTGDGPRFIRLGGWAVGYAVEDLDAWLDGQRDHTEDAR